MQSIDSSLSKKYMSLRMVAACMALALECGAAPAPHPSAQPTAVITFRAPAEYARTGPITRVPGAAVVPSGRVVAPVGRSIDVGRDARGLTLARGEHFAVIAGTAAQAAASTLEVVDLARMRVVAGTAAADAPFSGGIAVVADPDHPERQLVFASIGASDRVAVYDLDDTGALTPDAIPTIAIHGNATTAAHTNQQPVTLVAGEHRVYALAERGDAVYSIDPATRKVTGNVSVGFSPRAAAVVGDRLLVVNEALVSRREVARAAHRIIGSVPAADLDRASSLDSIALDPTGDFAHSAAQPTPLDPTPNGVTIIGGAHPSAIAAGTDEAFLAMTGVDRIATVALSKAAPVVVGGTELRLFDRGPYGTWPQTLALDASRKRLYVGLAGINAIAVLDVRDPKHPHRLGLLPSGALPSAMRLSRDGLVLYAISTRGLGTPDDHSVFQRIDLATTKLARSTPAALSDLRRIGAAAPTGVLHAPQHTKIRTVVVIGMPPASYDAALGDLTDAAGGKLGDGDPSRVRFGTAVMPNLHALARSFTVCDDLLDEAASPGEGEQIALAGSATPFSIRTGTDDLNAAPRNGDLIDAAGRSRVPFRAILAPLGPTTLHNVDRAKTLLHGIVPSDAPRLILVSFAAPSGLSAQDAATDADTALGSIVKTFAADQAWAHTAIVIAPWTTGDSDDHVDVRRGYAVLVSPYAKRGFVDTRHRSLAGLLKTEEELVGLAPVSLGDLLASDLGEAFLEKPVLSPAPLP